MVFRVYIAAWVSDVKRHAIPPICVQRLSPLYVDGLASEKFAATTRFLSEQALKLCLRIWGDSSKNGLYFLHF